MEDLDRAPGKQMTALLSTQKAGGWKAEKHDWVDNKDLVESLLCLSSFCVIDTVSQGCHEDSSLRRSRVLGPQSIEIDSLEAHLSSEFSTQLPSLPFYQFPPESRVADGRAQGQLFWAKKY